MENARQMACAIVASERWAAFDAASQLIGDAAMNCHRAPPVWEARYAWVEGLFIQAAEAPRANRGEAG